MEKIFKIRDKSTGLFSKGGVRGEFSKKGKVWKTEGYVRSHLQQFVHTREDEQNRLMTNIDNWEIIEYELIEKETTDLFTFISKGDAKVEYDLLTKLQKD